MCPSSPRQTWSSNLNHTASQLFQVASPRADQRRLMWMARKRLGSPSQVGQKSETAAWTPATTLLSYLCIDSTRGAERIFLRGGAEIMEVKAMKRKIACDKNSQESTYIVDKQLTVLTTKPGSFQLNCHLVSLIFSANESKTRQLWLHFSAKFCFDLWLFIYCRKHVSHVDVSFISAKFKKLIKLLCAKLVVLTCLMRLLIFLRFFPHFVSWFHQHTQGLSASTDNIRCKHNTPFAKCAFMDFVVG